MENGNQIALLVYPTSNPERSKTIFNTFLGVAPYVDGDYYIGYRVGDKEVGLDPSALGQGLTSPIAYIDTADIRKSQEDLVDAGAEVVQDATDVGAGLLIAKLKDADGNIFGLRQSVES